MFFFSSCFAFLFAVSTFFNALNDIKQIPIQLNQHGNPSLFDISKWDYVLWMTLAATLVGFFIGLALDVIIQGLHVNVFFKFVITFFISMTTLQIFPFWRHRRRITYTVADQYYNSALLIKHLCIHFLINFCYVTGFA